MTITLYDTMTAKKQPFAPAEPGKARIYVCGPTVYDYAHVGHARCYVIYDVLARHLRARGVELKYVRNITDVDDKIVHRAKERGETPTELAARFTTHFHEDMRALGNVDPDVEPTVSGHIPEIVAFVEGLIEKGHAYAVDGDVYFHVPSFEGYGKLSHRPVEALVEGASGRLSDEETKRKKHPADFALWKGQDADAWGWASPWGHGRPGWHIECSAMCNKHCGATLDLHGGGLDLVFPHHENEVAQSEAGNRAPLSRHWMHNGFVEVDKEKMSKSLGNFFTARELFTRYAPESMRYAMMTVHYRSPLNFDVTLDDAGHVMGFPLFDESEKRLEYLYETRERLASIDPSRIVAEGVVPDGIATFGASLGTALDDDLNMPQALAALSELLKAVNELVEGTRRKKGTAPAPALEAATAAFDLLGRELGLGLANAPMFLRALRDKRTKARGITDADVESRIAARKAARDGKDFGKADQLRDELVAMGVELMDGPTGTTWRIPG
ncbi:MAG: cysteine--tRNA ligase [Deltaproteobacteria bacterium]|nr:cysteine--tRNA ligase [Deltaproteobacteria bacterium]